MKQEESLTKLTEELDTLQAQNEDMASTNESNTQKIQELQLEI